MELRQQALMLWRGKWFVILGATLAALAALVTSSLMTPIFQASTILLINQAPDSNTSDYTAILTSERLARTYVQLFATRPILDETLTRLGITMDLEDFEDLIEVKQIRDTQMIELNVEHKDPALASDLANTLVEVFVERNDDLQARRFTASEESLKAQLDKLSNQIQINETAIAGLGTPFGNSRRAELERLQSELAQYQGSYTSLLQSYEELRMAEARTISNIIQVQPAEPPDEPVRPRIFLNTVLAGAVGAMIAMGSIFLIEYLDDTIRTPDDVERVFEAPILGFIAETKDLGKANQGRRLLAEESPPAVTEAFHSLRTNLEFLGDPGGPRSILVSSIGPGEGKTTVAGHLAASIAMSGKRVVLVDADLRRPGVHRFFGLSNKIGLSDMLKDDLVPQIATQELGSHRFRVITSGSKVDNPAELFGSIWLLKVLAYLRELSDVTVFDAPPFMAAEAYILAARLAGVLIVIQSGKTREAAARSTMRQLDRAQANVLGVVLNRVPRSQLYGAGQYPYYDYDWQPRQEDGRKRAPEPRKAALGADAARRGSVVMRQAKRED